MAEDNQNKIHELSEAIDEMQLANYGYEKEMTYLRSHPLDAMKMMLIANNHKDNKEELAIDAAKIKIESLNEQIRNNDESINDLLEELRELGVDLSTL